MAGTWLGIISKTGGHIIAKADGEAIRVRSVQPCPDEDKCNAEAVLGVRAPPRTPNPNTDGAADQAEPKLNGSETEAARLEAT